MLGKSCSVANCSKRTADIEYIFPSGALGRNREAKYYFPLKREHFTFVDLPQKWSHSKPDPKKSTFIPRTKKLIIFCVISIGIYLVNVHNCGTIFLEASPEVKDSQIKAFHFFDV